MRKIIGKLSRRLRREEGVTAIEYGLLAALIALVIIVAVTAVGTGLSTTFNRVETGLAAPSGAPTP